MIGPLDIALAPWRGARGLVRALDDLNALAERARRDPDPVETLTGAIRTVDASAVALAAGGEDLLEATRELNSTARTIEAGGRDLRHTGESLDAHTQELIAGGQELTDVAKDLAHSLRILRSEVGTVAETVEPLQGVARGVGRVTDRLSSRG